MSVHAPASPTFHAAAGHGRCTRRGPNCSSLLKLPLSIRLNSSAVLASACAGVHVRTPHCPDGPLRPCGGAAEPVGRAASRQAPACSGGYYLFAGRRHAHREARRLISDTHPAPCQTRRTSSSFLKGKPQSRTQHAAAARSHRMVPAVMPGDPVGSSPTKAHAAPISMRRSMDLSMDLSMVVSSTPTECNRHITCIAS
jgi:hypothetical protein